jgi:peptide/nickel transport system substrate-binding protein
VRTLRPCALLGRILTIPILPAHAARKAGAERTYSLRTRFDSLAVNGPFVPVSWVPSRRIVLVRNPHYCGRSAAGARLPWLDSVVVNFVRDHNTHMVRFQRGETDLFPAAGKDYTVLAQDSSRSYHMYCMGPSRMATVLLFNQHTGRDSAGTPFVDSVKQSWFRAAAFRRAVGTAIDRAAVMEAAGVSGFAQYGPVCPADTHLLAARLPTLSYDTAAARSMLRDAGFADRDSDRVLEDGKGNSVQFSIMVAAENLARRSAAEKIATELAGAGMAVSVQVVEHGYAMNTLRNPPHLWEAALVGMACPREPLEAWEVWHSTGRLHVWETAGEIGAGQVRIDSLLTAALATPDTKARLALYTQWQTAFAELLPVVFVYAPERIVCVNTHLGNASPAPVEGLFRDAALLYRLKVPRENVRQALLADTADTL